MANLSILLLNSMFLMKDSTPFQLLFHGESVVTYVSHALVIVPHCLSLPNISCQNQITMLFLKNKKRIFQDKELWLFLIITKSDPWLKDGSLMLNFFSFIPGGYSMKN